MTEPLDLEEGKRLLQEARIEPPKRERLVAFHEWLYNNTDALLEAAAERDRLRRLLRKTRPLIDYARDVPRCEITALHLAADIDATLSPAAPEEDRASG